MCGERNPGQLGPRTTRTETSRPVSENKSARKRGLVGPYVKTTRTKQIHINMMKKKNEQANSKKKYKCEIVYQQKCAMYTDVTF
jgi:hypothetical protein